MSYCAVILSGDRALRRHRAPPRRPALSLSKGNLGWGWPSLPLVLLSRAQNPGTGKRSLQANEIGRPTTFLVASLLGMTAENSASEASSRTRTSLRETCPTSGGNK